MNTHTLYNLGFLILLTAAPAFGEWTDLNGGQYPGLTGLNKNKNVWAERWGACNSFNDNGSRALCGMIGTYTAVNRACAKGCAGGLLAGSLTEKIGTKSIIDVVNKPIEGAQPEVNDAHCAMYGVTGENPHPSYALPRCAICNNMTPEGRYLVPGMIGTWYSDLKAFDKECAPHGGVNPESITEYVWGEPSPCQPTEADSCTQESCTLDWAN